MGQKINIWWWNLALSMSLFLGLGLGLGLCENNIDGVSASATRTESWKLVTEDMLKQPCEEIYVVKEGESVHTISEKCGDPFILEENPHINDPDDVFPGLIIKITPFRNR
ncbi:unnamed protein product [Amaranthus hypochondriacus]